jgi:hypothetical protein
MVATKTHKKKVLVKKGKEALLYQTLCVYYIPQFSTNEAFICTSLLMTKKILSSRPRTPFKSLHLKKRDHEQHGQIESLRS